MTRKDTQAWLLSYRLPEERDEQILADYTAEHYLNGEYSITAGMGLETMPFGAWLEQVHIRCALPAPDWGRSCLLLCFHGKMLVGLLHVRYELSDDLRGIYGDIGYGVRPSQRRRGYASSMLAHGLQICRAHHMKEVIVGCFKSNTASARTIIGQGGRLVCECDRYEKGRLSQYYRIDLQ